MNYPCGFASVNKGKHCFILGKCVVCGEEENGKNEDSN